LQKTRRGPTPEQEPLHAEPFDEGLAQLIALMLYRPEVDREFEAYADPDQDLAALYNRIHSEYLGADMHDVPVWALNQMYGSDPIYLESYIVGEMVASQILDTLEQRFGNCCSKRAGNFLKANFYSQGAELISMF